MHAPLPCLSLLSLLLLLSFAGSPTAASAGPLETARTLAATRYKDWTYGSDATKNQIDCVQFILAIVEEELSSTLATAPRNAILINHGWSAAETQLKAADGTDPKLAGVQYALVDLLHKGTVVQPADAQAGDLIQYWMKKADGSWFGHSGVIASVSQGKANLFSASASAGKIDDKPLGLKLAGADRRIYIVRLTP